MSTQAKFHDVSMFIDEEDFEEIIYKEFEKKIKSLVENYQIGDIILINSDYNSKYRFAIINENKNLTFNQFGCYLPIINKDIKKYNVKYNTLFHNVLNNSEYIEEFFDNDKTTCYKIVDKLIQNNLWDLDYKYNRKEIIEDTSDEDISDEDTSDEECLGCATGTGNDSAHRIDIDGSFEFHPNCSLLKKNDSMLLSEKDIDDLIKNSVDVTSDYFNIL